jgi:hypothetical protein
MIEGCQKIGCLTRNFAIMQSIWPGIRMQISPFSIMSENFVENLCIHRSCKVTSQLLLSSLIVFSLGYGLELTPSSMLL